MNPTPPPCPCACEPDKVEVIEAEQIPELQPNKDDGEPGQDVLKNASKQLPKVGHELVQRRSKRNLK
jgi:hypothetical protein